MKKYIILLLVAASTSFFVGCNSDDDFNPPNYVTFEKGPLPVGVDMGGSKSFDVTVYTANIVGSDRTFNVEVGGSSTLGSSAYTVPGTVTVPGGSNEGILTVNISDVGIGANGETLILNIASQEGVFIGSPVTLNVTQVCPFTETVLSFAFDGWASETSWEIVNADGDVVFQGGGYADGAVSATRNLCLSPGEYTFTVFDAYGDGMSDPANGSVTLMYGSTELGVITGNFGDEASIEFTLN